MSESYNELWIAASSKNDNLFELAIAAFRRVVAMQNTSLLPAFDSVANAARDAETNDAYWNAIEALWDVAKGDVKAALNRVIFDGPKE